MGLDHYANQGPASVTIAAAGANQGAATECIEGVTNVVTGASGTNGVRLPVGVAGDIVRVYSSAATNAILVYPPTGGTINAGSANASLSVAARKPAVFECLDGTNWTGLVGA